MFSALITYLPSALILYTVGLFIFLKRNKNPSHTLFFLIAYFAATREVLLFIEALNQGTKTATLLVRLSFMLIAPCIGFLYYFCQYFPKIQKPINKRFLWFTVVLVVLLSILSLSDFLVPYDKTTKLYIPSVLIYYGSIIVYFIASIDVLYRKLHGSKAPEKNQIRLIITSIGFIILTNLLEDTLLVPFGKDTVFTNFVSSFSFALFGLAIAYAMIKYRFFDIRSAVARSAAYSALFGILIGIYGGATYVFTNIIVSNQPLILMCIGALLALSFFPLKRLIDKASNRVFYRDAYDIRAVLELYQDSLEKIIDHNHIINATVSTLKENIKARSVIFKDSTAINNRYLYILNSRYLYIWKVSYKNTIFGYLCFDEKLSGASYSNKDKRLIKLIGTNMALALQNSVQYNEIKSFANKLEKEIKIATKELSKQNESLAALSSQKDEFISMASHQLRPQLTAVNGFTELLLHSEISKKESGEILTLIATSTRRMMKLVSDMLNTNDDHAINVAETFDIVQLVEDEIKTFQSQTKYKNIEIELKTIKPTFVTGSTFQTKEILLNYLDNAVAYSTPNSPIFVLIAIEKNLVKVTVQDKGSGIHKKDIPHIFTKFYRSKEAMSVRPTGTGIGLFVAKKFAQSQGGNVGFHSTKGKGSNFWFTIPKVS